MASNNLSGVVKLDTFLELKNLEFLRLSNNKLSVLSKTSPNASPPRLIKLRLVSRNLTSFPDFLQNQGLQILDLSFNHLHGLIPKWLWEMSKKTLLLINLSHNSLTSFEEPPLILPCTNLIRLNIGNNMLRGSLPIPPLSTVIYLVSNNSLEGEISPLLCNVSSLQVLDVSYNNLSGMIPQCFTNFRKSLAILDLYANDFSGPIPRIWRTGNKLHLINLGLNKFYGQVRRSIARCTLLQYLDLGDNQIQDTFPSWLGVLQNLRVLILRSNGFHGTIGAPRSDSVFPELRIIDLSSNMFTGFLPSKYFKIWNAMRNLSAESFTCMHLISTVFAVEYNYKYRMVYNYSMTLTNKVVRTKFTQVSEVFTAIDLSCNRFQGEIPDSIGNLKGLQVLNLSNNLLVGQIPLVIGSLSKPEALDLSCNKLVGRIPWQLKQLNILAVFNVSHNHLTGPIPQGGQFNTFESSSFDGNLGLCGNLLSTKCEDSEASSPSSSTSEEHEDLLPISHFGWKVVLMGYGFVMVIGVIISQIIIKRKPHWFIKIFGVKQWKRPIKSLARW
ncbi:Leucine-rich repeat - like 10 [Theobroma cacao]|nr:Leucine-rich repeat - like 10 [Theobroma cacao]